MPVPERRVAGGRRPLGRRPVKGSSLEIDDVGDSASRVQRTRGNASVQALARLPLKPAAAHAAQQGEAERAELLKRLLAGEVDINQYTTGVCYDTVAFVMYLRGLVTPDQLMGLNGQGWLNAFAFESHHLWRGEGIPPASAVGFKRVGHYKPEFFHGAVSIGGTRIRGVNSLLSPGWSAPMDFAAQLEPHDDGVYMFDGQPTQVWYR